MSDPILARPITWRDLRRAPTAETCAVCRRTVAYPDEAPCERCSSPLHFSCWLAIASRAEHATFQAAVLDAERDALSAADAAAVERLVLLCPGCRS